MNDGVLYDGTVIAKYYSTYKSYLYNYGFNTEHILVYRVTDGVPYHTHIFQLYYSHSIIIWSYYDACGGSVWCVLLYTKLQFMFNDIWSLNIIFSIIYVNLSLQGINLRVIKSRDIFVYIPIPRIYRLVLYI